MILRPIKRLLSPCTRLWQGKKGYQLNFSHANWLHVHRLSLCPPYSYTHDIEALSCDELLMDSSALLAELCINPEELSKAIRADIKEKTGCCASVGMGKSSFDLKKKDQHSVEQAVCSYALPLLQGPTSCWLGSQPVRPSQMANTS